MKEEYNRGAMMVENCIKLSMNKILTPPKGYVFLNDDVVYVIHDGCFHV